MGNILIGISGWRSEPWRGVFYPVDLPQHRELEFASRQLPTIEINGSFYSLQRPRLRERVGVRGLRRTIGKSSLAPFCFVPA